MGIPLKQLGLFCVVATAALSAARFGMHHTVDYMHPHQSFQKDASSARAEYHADGAADYITDIGGVPMTGACVRHTGSGCRDAISSCTPGAHGEHMIVHRWSRVGPHVDAGAAVAWRLHQGSGSGSRGLAGTEESTSLAESGTCMAMHASQR
jgi:hypothetical protein